jgi:hypothetical protein
MDDNERALLSRVRMTVPDVASGRCELDLDGWPLLLVDKVAGCVRVNDLGSSSIFADGVALPSTAGQLMVRAGAIGDELYVLVGDVAAVFVVAEINGVHADVRVVEPATGRLLLDRSVRYRQVPTEVISPSPALRDCRG